MNYYKRHLGDYARKAGHLSMLEHGAYNLILDAYYDREVAPTRAEAIRYARARLPEEVAAVDVVLAEFFTEEDGRFYQSRVEDEFKDAEIQAERNRENGKRGGRPRKAAPSTSEKPKKTQSVFSGNPDESEKKGNPLIHQSTNPEEEAKALVQRSAARFEEFWAAYPEKKGKAAAEKSWKAKGCDAIADQILAHVQRMQAEDRAWREGFIPHGSTYVNGERWQDEPKRAPPPGGQAQQPSKTLSAIQLLEGMKNGLDDKRNHDRLSEAPLLELGSDPRD